MILGVSDFLLQYCAGVEIAAWKYSITMIIITAIVENVKFIKADHDKILFELVIGRIVTITRRGTDSSVIKRSHDTLAR